MKSFKTDEDCLKLKSHVLEGKKYWRIELRGSKGGFFPALYKIRKKALQVKIYFLYLIQNGYYVTCSSVNESRLILRKFHVKLLSHEEDNYIFSVERDSESRIYTSWIQYYTDSDNSQKGFRLFGLLKIGDIPISEISKERLIYIAKRDPILTIFTGVRNLLFSSRINESLL